MGKKKRNSRLNASENSSFNRSSSVLSEELPEKFSVSFVETTGCSKFTKNLEFLWKDVVFMHPSVMRGYNIEDTVLIIGEEKTALYYTFPVEQLQKGVIVFPKHDSTFKSQENVTLQKYESEIKSAGEIFISFDEKYYDVSDNMKEHILRLLSNKYIYEGLILQWDYFGRNYHCTVKSIICSPNSSQISFNIAKNYEFYVVTYRTVIKVLETVENAVNRTDKIGGLEKQRKLLESHLHKFLNRPTYCGILMLRGPSGTGKSLLLQTILKELALHTEYVKWYELCPKSQVEVKKLLKDIFQQAVDNAPSIIVIEEYNYLCPNKNVIESIHQCISNVLLKVLRSINDAKVMVIASSDDLECDTSVLQQSEILMDVIKFGIPSACERLDILQKLLLEYDHGLTQEQIQEIAGLAHGFTGKDLKRAIKDALIIACRRENSAILHLPEFLNTIRNKGNRIGSVQYSDLYCCVKLKKKSIVTASDIKIKKVQWSDIGGMTDVKAKLKQVVEWPLKHAEAFKRFNITPSRGVLMYGPPGCSKTMIAKALAAECELNFISKNAADLYDKYVGESEKAIRDLFALAKAKSPCIIFLDEIDALVTKRESASDSSGVGNRIVTTLLTEMDGIEELHGVIIIAATNRPDRLDDALVRYGRINHFIYVPLPDVATREEILKISMRNRVVSDDFDFKILAAKTEGYSGAEIVNLCNEAALQLLSENPKTESPIFSVDHFECALKYVPPRTSREMIQFYEAFNIEHCT